MKPVMVRRRKFGKWVWDCGICNKPLQEHTGPDRRICLNSQLDPAEGNGSLAYWNVPMRIADDRGNPTDQMLRFMMGSDSRRKRFQRVLTMLQEDNLKQYQVFMRCVLGADDEEHAADILHGRDYSFKQSQAQLAKEWGVSRSAVTHLKNKAIDYLSRKMGSEAEEILRVA